MAPEGNSPSEYEKNYHQVAQWLLERQKATGVQLLWNTANVFNHPRYMNGAATNPDFDVVARAGLQIKNCLDVNVLLGGHNYVFWGGREGYMSRVGMDDVMLLIVGEGGMLQVSLRAPESLLFWEKERNGAYKGSCVPCPVTTQKPFEGWFLSEMRGFIDAIEGDIGLGATISQGLYVEKVLFAAEQAALSAREVRV